MGCNCSHRRCFANSETVCELSESTLARWTRLTHGVKRLARLRRIWGSLGHYLNHELRARLAGK